MKEDILIRLDNYEGYNSHFRQQILDDAYTEIEQLRDAVRNYDKRIGEAMAALNGEEDDD
jgi:hypothetical protein